MWSSGFVVYNDGWCWDVVFTLISAITSISRFRISSYCVLRCYRTVALMVLYYVCVVELYVEIGTVLSFVPSKLAYTISQKAINIAGMLKIIIPTLFFFVLLFIMCSMFSVNGHIFMYRNYKNDQISLVWGWSSSHISINWSALTFNISAITTGCRLEI